MSEHKNEQNQQICILGGGFGGLYTALRLSQLPWREIPKPEITLVDQNDRFVFLPLLYELLTGELQTWEIAPPYAEILANTGIRFQQAPVRGINIHTKKVHLGNEHELSYDRLVLALGGETPLDMVPGVAAHALPFRTIQHVYELEARLRILEESDRDNLRVAIIGGGYSGVELACKLAERLGDRGRIRLVELGENILRNSPEFNREAAKKALAAKKVWLDLETGVEKITADSIELNYKGQIDTIPVDLVLWTVGTQVAAVVKSLPLPHNGRGQLQTSKTLQVIDHPEIYALGDLADCQDATGQQIPPTAQAAFQQADYAGWNIWADLTDRPILPFRYQNLGEMMTLGTDNATLTGLGVTLEGNLAHVVRRLAYLSRMPTLEHQLKVGVSWMTKPILDLLS
ncbi:MAG: NAD(P)/FAD-dependent oxidoreductase [Coleofasciculaceae cyanobacterium SM2_1_6]|nr:NAD(P)/FAD-dependent oxidoreductase [Coleofasciculaceae cyanobacterium SM2_1_6]